MVDTRGTSIEAEQPASTTTLRADRCFHTIYIRQCPKVVLEHETDKALRITLGKIVIHVFKAEDL
jgi:hypothetical protein